MWYSASDGSNYRIYYATSSNGTDWSKYNNTTPANSNTTSTNGTIPRGTGGSGDDTHIQSPTVTKEDSLYKMWYSGSDGSNWRIYYAYSLDGINWQKVNNATPANSNTTSTEGRIPRGTSGGDTTHASDPFVLIDGGEYRMWYSGSNGTYRGYYAKVEKDYLVEMSMPKISTPSSARAVGYEFRVDNYGTRDSWEGNINCSSLSGEDQCTRSTSDNVQNFVPSSVPVSQVLTAGGGGEVAAYYYYLNKCDDGKRYSTSIKGYYQINLAPKIVDPCDTNPAIAADDPSCPESEVCDMEPDKKCTIDEIVPEKSLCNGRASDTWYTGKTLNNPLKMRVAGYDPDGTQNIRGAMFWFSKNSPVSDSISLSDTYLGTSLGNLGILVVKNGSDWNSPVFYTYSDSEWGRMQEVGSVLEIRNSSGERIGGVIKGDSGNYLKVYEGTIITFEMSLLFNENSSLQHFAGEYGVNLEVLDSSSFTGTQVYLPTIQRFFNWGIDLQDPDVSSFKEKVLTPESLELSWRIDGTNSKITDFVLNAYRLDPGDDGKVGSIDMVDMVDVGQIEFEEPYEIPPEEEIGLLDDTNSWQFNNLTPSSNIYQDSRVIGIGANELGTIVIYSTAYDQACNVSKTVLNVNLDPWFATKGGVVYSKGYSGIGAKSMSDEMGYNPFERIKMLVSEIDKGTELVATRHQVVESFLRSIGGVRVTGVYDSNEKKNFWFSYLTKKLGERKEEFKAVNKIDECSPAGLETCLIEVANIEIPKGAVCKGKILVVAEGDIVINPDLTTYDATSGCIFLAKGDIKIKGGDYLSASRLEYDMVEGFFLSENVVSIEYVDVDKLKRDGLQIKGGVVALGRDTGGAASIDIKRNLRLYNYSYPTLVVSYDPRYSDISRVFFGTESPMYKQEVGFKGI